jgi:hypothetical protein
MATFQGGPARVSRASPARDHWCDDEAGKTGLEIPCDGGDLPRILDRKRRFDHGPQPDFVVRGKVEEMLGNVL